VLIDYLPSRFQNSPEMVDIQKALGILVNLVEKERDLLLLQCNVETATWGLDLWEKEYGIATDKTKPYDFRRSRIKAKMRGQGTTTVEMIKNVAESFVNGLVDVVEHNEEYRFDVNMVSVIGVPPNMEDLRSAIEEIKPAHLAYEIILRYNTWKMASILTWGEASNFTWKQLREEALKK